MTRRCATLLIRAAVAVTGLMLTACAARIESARPPAPELTDEGTAAKRVLLPTADSGLQVREWRVLDDAGDPNRIAAILMKYAVPATEGEPDALRLARNGFRLVPVPTDALTALQEELGTTRDVEGWYGQAYEWRTVVEVPLDAAAQTVAIDGRVGTLQGGRLRLVVRGWTTPMEDGPYMYVEIVPEHDRTRSTRLAQVLGRRAFVGDRFPGAGVRLMMEAGTAWVLTAAAPGEAWTRGPEVLPEPDAGRAAGGPVAEAPPTIGGLLLRREERSSSQRELLVFVPMIPSSLVPPPLSGDPRTMDVARRDRAPGSPGS